MGQRAVHELTPFPLPVRHRRRQSPLDFIPAVEHTRGDRVWALMALMQITQGPHTGRRLGEVAPEWQRAWVRAIYATDCEGTRLFAEAFLCIAKKNGKSSLSALLALAHVMAFPQERGLAIVLSDTKEQSGIIYDAMVATVEADSFLTRAFKIRSYKRDIIHRPTGTQLRVASSELGSTTGTVPSFYICDELHLIGLRPRGAALVRQLSSGAAVHRDSLGVYISTMPIDLRLDVEARAPGARRAGPGRQADPDHLRAPAQGRCERLAAVVDAQSLGRLDHPARLVTPGA